MSREFTPTELGLVEGLYTDIRAVTDEHSLKTRHVNGLTIGDAYHDSLVHRPVSQDTMLGDMNVLAGWLSEERLSVRGIVTIIQRAVGSDMPTSRVDKSGLLIRSSAGPSGINALSVLTGKVSYAPFATGNETYTYSYDNTLLVAAKEGGFTAYLGTGHLNVTFERGGDQEELHRYWGGDMRTKKLTGTEFAGYIDGLTEHAKRTLRVTPRG